MTRFVQIMLLSCAGLVLTGCNGVQRDEPVWQRLKITDLAPSGNIKRPHRQLLKTINFSVYIFEMPAENIGALDEIWPMLYTKPLKFDSSYAFGANSFLAGFGQLPMWNKIADLLAAAGGKKVQTFLLLLADGQADDITITGLRDERTIYYISPTGSMEDAKVGTGRLSLRIKADKIAGSRGLCRMSALPVFARLRRSRILQLAKHEKLGDFLFTTCRFASKMGPGDFVLLGPAEYIGHQATLGSLFFSRGGYKPIVRTFLIVCTSIND